MLPKKGKELHRRVQDGSVGETFGPMIAAALKAELGLTHQAIKTVMRWTGASERTAKHWFAGTHHPSAEHLVTLMRHSDMVLTAVLVMANREGMLANMKILILRERMLELIEMIDTQREHSA
ncbi:hypothetical protein [Niveispirillum sp.]|uniref:hypothetical protein n=1 Tax=Niveispirillum sp. TaxID=1917217 RepID=UPI001B5A1987|nr:hypothetical protein [Niveispirillum sp.]MBP7340268.1 hypothetical protein [Niveispirillum sp.]